jgi:hypothetical protein
MSMEKCPDCLDPCHHLCINCRQNFCGCDQGSYYMLIGPSEYSCQSCRGGIPKLPVPRHCDIGVAIQCLIIIFIVFELIGSQIYNFNMDPDAWAPFGWWSVAGLVICLGVGIYVKPICEENTRRTVQEFKSWAKRPPGETKAEHRHRLNHYRWDYEIMASGLE